MPVCESGNNVPRHEEESCRQHASDARSTKRDGVDECLCPNCLGLTGDGPDGFALQLLAPRQFGLRGLCRTTDGRRLHLAIARMGRGDDAVGRDGAVRQCERPWLATVAEQALALAEQHRERERADLIDEASSE